MVSVEFKEKRSLDEGFWQDVEARVKSNLGQPCCTLSGISSGLITMPGDFAVVIHGEHECASCFHHVGPSVDRFSAGLNEADFTSGETRDKLEECLELVVEEVNPKVIFVLGACPCRDHRGPIRDDGRQGFGANGNTDGFTAHQWAESGFPGGDARLDVRNLGGTSAGGACEPELGGERRTFSSTSGRIRERVESLQKSGC